MKKESISFFSTPFGVGVVHASEHGITKVDLPDISQVASVFRETPSLLQNSLKKPPPSEDKSSALTDYVAEKLSSYFCGERIDFKDIQVDISGIPSFRYKVLYSIRNIPYGEVRSYGDIAAECGSPGAARAVGGAMASNPVPVIIPCHRIVGGDGRLTGFSAPGGETTKMMLLKMEGVEFKGLLAIKK